MKPPQKPVKRLPGYTRGGNLFAAERFHERWPPYVFMNDVENPVAGTTADLLIR